jgi:hypothetical protein
LYDQPTGILPGCAVIRVHVEILARLLPQRIAIYSFVDTVAIFQLDPAVFQLLGCQFGPSEITAEWFVAIVLLLEIFSRFSEVFLLRHCEGWDWKE